MIRTSQSVWDVKADIVAIPTNSTLDKKGYLVMGAGLALQAKKRYPQLPRLAGDWINNRQKRLGQYSWFVVEQDDRRIGCLQTKIDWRDPSTVDIVSQSLFCLNYFLRFTDPTTTIAMPLPGCGLGGLSKDVVLKMVEVELGELGDRVVLCIPNSF